MLPEWEAVFDDRPFCVFGRTLPPLTLGHLYLLENIRSPVVTGAEASPDDVLMAAWLCSHPHLAARQSLRSADVAAAWVQWGRDWASTVDATLTGYAAAVAAECARFRDYLAHWLRAPRRWKSGEGAAGTKTPWMLFMVAELMRHLNLPEAEVWAMPCAKAFAYYAATCEAQGDKDLMTPREAAQVDAIKAASAGAVS